MAKKQKIRLQRIEEAVQSDIDQLVQLLKEKPAGAEYIHRVRVHIKRLRAWLRLQRVKIDEFYWKDMDTYLRDHALSLGQVRDKQITSEKLQKFATRTISADEVTAINRVLRNCKDLEATATIDWGGLKQGLLADLSMYREYYICVHSIKELRTDLKRQYKRTRNSARNAYAETARFEDLHRLRKDVKTLNYQVGFLNKGFNNRAKPVKKKLAMLGELLGHVHDIDVIQHYINQIPARQLYKAQRACMARILERELQQLLLESRALYDSTFCDPAKDFISFIK
ncbi:MAG: CHAD domain-containing protein [Gammaproteobacteria bacterium]